jgi:hypothetical protein
MLKLDTVDAYRNGAAGRWRSLTLFAGLGLASGALSTGVSDWLSTDLWTSPLVGVAFGVAICLAFYLTVKPTRLRLLFAFLAIQLAWQAAIQTGIYVDDQTRSRLQIDLPSLWNHGAQQSVAPDAPQPGGQDNVSQSSSRLWRYDQKMILPGLTAGAVGAMGTWLGALFCAAGLSTLAAFALAVITGALAGLFLGFDMLVLFPVWQMAVAAALGVWVPARGNAAAQALAG